MWVGGAGTQGGALSEGAWGGASELNLILPTHTNQQKQVREGGPMGDEDGSAGSGPTSPDPATTDGPGSGPGGRGGARGPRKAYTFSIPSLRAGGNTAAAAGAASTVASASAASSSGAAAGAAAVAAFLLKTAEEYARDTRTPVVHSKRYFKHKRLPVRFCVFALPCRVV